MASAVTEVQSVARSNFAFSNALHEQLRLNGQSENLVYSPFSLGLVLLMARFGARGETAEQLDRTLHPIANTSVVLDNLVPIRRGFFRVLKSIADDRSGHYNVTVANRMFTGTGFTVEEEFKKISRATLNTKVKQLDFLEEGGRLAVDAINSWVANKTNGKIKGIMSTGSFRSQTQVVLVNTIHFKAPWDIPFDPEATQDAPFHLSSNDQIQVAMMRSEARYENGDLGKLNARAVVIPYQGKRYSMHVYIPKINENLDTLLRALKATSMRQIRERLVKPGNCERVYLSLPKFKVQSDLKLVEPLKKMGTSRMFSSDLADFSGISEDQNVYVSDVVQKAYITVDEEGTEASASSSIQAGVVCSPTITNVTADRPFYFQIVDEKNDMVLFAGTVRDPSAVVVETDVIPTEAASNKFESSTVGTTARTLQPSSSLPPLTRLHSLKPAVNVETTTEKPSAGLEPRIVFGTYEGGIKVYSEITKDVTTIIESRENITGVTWDSINNQLYYCVPYAIYTVKIDGSNKKTAGTFQPNYGDFTGLDFDGITGNLYGVTEGGYIFVCKSAQGGTLSCQILLRGQGRFYGIAVDPTRGTMYWTSNSANDVGSIVRASLDGRNRVVIATRLEYPCGIAIDHESSRIFWTDYSGHRIQSSDLSGQNVTEFVSSKQQRGPWGIVVHNGKVYWGDYDAKSINSLTKAGNNAVESVYIGNRVSHLTIASANIRSIARFNPCAGRWCAGICVLTPVSYRCVLGTPMQ